MRSNSLLLAAACTLPFSLVACGSSDSSSGDDDNSGVTPTGDHHQYVVKKAMVTGTSADDFALDLGSKTSSTPDGRVDNRIGGALNLLQQTAFDIQGTVDKAINAGELILLVDVQTTDFTNNTAGAGFGVKFGATPNPPACSSATDTVCGGHLQGGAAFTIAADSPTNASLAGKVINSVFNAGPGNVGLQIAFGTSAVTLNLTHARAQATGISATGIASIKVGGLLTMSDLATQVGPAIQTAVAGILTTDCTGTPKTTANGCGCPAGSTGAKVINLLDTAPADCTVSLTEILGYAPIATLLTPDSCSTDSCTTPDALSIGVKVEAVSATFPM